MDKLSKKRAALRTSFTKLCNQIRTTLEESNPDEIDVKASFEMLREKYEEIVVQNTEIIDLLMETNAEESELEKEYDSQDKYSTNLKKLELTINKKFEKIDNDGMSIRSNNVNVVTRRFKLPQLELVKFSGELKDWLPFWNQYKQIHEDESVPAVEKFQYLKQCTVTGSRARAVVESFPATEENYAKAVESLTARFGREDLLVEVYVRELLKLVLKNVSYTAGKVAIAPLYDKLESHLRSLESLGITDDKFDAMLYPLVESSLPDDILRIWQRSTNVEYVIKEDDTTSIVGSCRITSRLNKLMQFLKKEIENEERIALARVGFGVEQTKRRISNKEEFPTSAGLLSTKERKCVFCDKDHDSENCKDAENLSFENKKKLLLSKRCCFVCLKSGHISKKCRSKIVCSKCSKRHYAVMCWGQVKNNKESLKDDNNAKGNINTTLANFSSTPEVSLQTLKLLVKGENTQRVVRAIFDTGSQRSYILQKTALAMNYEQIGQEKVIHALFGGAKSRMQTHNCYMVNLSSLDGKYKCRFQVLGQPVICAGVNPIRSGPWLEELQQHQIQLTDVEDSTNDIEILIGADVAGRLLTGRRHVLTNNMVAIETCLGWTIVGKIPSRTSSTHTSALTTLLAVDECDISNLWKLDIIGIEDPVEKKSREELDALTMQHFLETVNCTSDGRYEVNMPWIEGHPPLPSNYKIALNRFYKLLDKLKNDGYYNDYKTTLREWLDEGIIEEVPEEEITKYGHYLPHRHVVKCSSNTTKVRPVFDASAKVPRSPALNQCLEKGSNMIERIPKLLINFRLNKIGVLADIRKAFLQISVSKGDRDYLRFLWSDDFGKNIKTFRHTRVVFGIKCSPFLLGAVIEHHLKNCLKKCDSDKSNYSRESVERLKTSMYVDNTVTSVNNLDELALFKREAQEIMSEAKFDLRNWEFNSDVDLLPNPISPVLGLQWHRNEDVLSINPECLKFEVSGKITKRVILTTAHKIFDPIGFSCPVTLHPKLLLRRLWKEKLRWDEEVDREVSLEFLKWIGDSKYLRDVRIPRWFGSKISEESSSIHVFTDASQFAYAAIIFLKTESSEGVEINLLQARTRIAPMKKVTIPRLELLGAAIGARLYADVTTDAIMSKLPAHFWSDSSTVIAWIQRELNWGIFVRNRVEEIIKLTPRENWKHIPGSLNPADLLSRGCSAKQLLENEWWKGPSWLRQPCSEWSAKKTEYDEEEINEERKKTVVSALSIAKENSEDWFYRYFSKFLKILRLIGWIYRFKNNCLEKERINGELTSLEIENAEKIVMILIQQQSFQDEKNIKSLQPFKDRNGIIRLKTKIASRADDWEFLNPILLPGKHPVVDMLIRREHENICHAKGQILLSKIREKYWIIGGRRTIRRVTSKCVVCRRYDSKPFNTSPIPLPEDRVRDARAFEITGVDLAGPLYVRGNQKVWICLYTCAVYRAIHLELLTSLSTEAFLQSLRRFIARRGRPGKIYSDNGTNFIGANNLFKALNWNEITQYSSARQIKWKFNPPTASWWGGWWERLIRIIKELLKKVLGRAVLSYEELGTVICDCEAVVNGRPLTYISENPHDYPPLTPAMFIQDIQEAGVPDCDLIDHQSMNRRTRYRQKLSNCIRQRFRNEYLGQLIQNSKIKQTDSIKVGEIVLIGSDNTKKLNWPIAKVIELKPGSDGQIRLVKVRNSMGELLRPIQKIYPLEVIAKAEEEAQEVSEVVSEIPKQKTWSGDDEQLGQSMEKRTRKGRRIKAPQKLDLLSMKTLGVSSCEETRVGGM